MDLPVEDLREPNRDDLPAHVLHAMNVTGLHPWRIQFGTEDHERWQRVQEEYLSNLKAEERIALRREELWMTVTRRIAIYLDALSIDTELLDATAARKVARERALMRDELRADWERRDTREKSQQGYWQRFAMALLRGLFAEMDDAGKVTFSAEDVAFLDRLRADLDAE